MWCVCQSVQATAAESSFYGDHEVQTLSTANAYVTAGTFTVAYGAFSLQLPGTVSGYSLATAFTTTADLSPYLAPGDQIVVDGRTYTVAPYKFINRYLSTPLSFSHNQAAVVIHILVMVLACVCPSTTIPVMERIVSSVSPTADVIALPAFARPKTLPLAWNAGAGALQRALLNTPAFGQVRPFHRFSYLPRFAPS